MARLRILCFVAAVAGIPALGEVRLKTRTLAGPADLRSAPLVRKTRNRSHVLVQMDQAPSASTIRLWNGRGIQVAGHIPPSAVVLSVPDGSDFRAPGVRWAGR